MFNIYQFEDQLKVQTKIEKKQQLREKHLVKKQIFKDKEILICLLQYKLDQQEQLVVNYKKRLDHFLHEMQQSPIKIYDDISEMKTNLIYKFRNVDETKMLGSKTIKLKDNSTIINSPSNQKQNNLSFDMQQNNKSINQSSPYITQKQYEYRKRDKSKELFGDMQFKVSQKNNKIIDKYNCQKNDCIDISNQSMIIPQEEKQGIVRKIRPSTKLSQNSCLKSCNSFEIKTQFQEISNTQQQDQNSFLREALLKIQSQSNQKLKSNLSAFLENNEDLNIQKNNLALKTSYSQQDNYFYDVKEHNSQRKYKQQNNNLNKTLPDNFNPNCKTIDYCSNNDLFVNKHLSNQYSKSQTNDICIQNNKNIQQNTPNTQRSSSAQINQQLNNQRCEKIQNIINTKIIINDIKISDIGFSNNQQHKQNHCNSIRNSSQPQSQKKTHFKALTEIAIKQPLMKQEVKEVYDEKIVGNLINTNQIFNEKSTQQAMKVMNECNIFRTKNKCVKGIRRIQRDKSNQKNRMNITIDQL